MGSKQDPFGAGNQFSQSFEQAYQPPAAVPAPRVGMGAGGNAAFFVSKFMEGASRGRIMRMAEEEKKRHDLLSGIQTQMSILERARSEGKLTPEMEQEYRGVQSEFTKLLGRMIDSQMQGGGKGKQRDEKQNPMLKVLGGISQAMAGGPTPKGWDARDDALSLSFRIGKILETGMVSPPVQGPAADSFAYSASVNWLGQRQGNPHLKSVSSNKSLRLYYRAFVSIGWRRLPPMPLAASP